MVPSAGGQTGTPAGLPTSGLPNGTYCNTFLGNIMLQGSGALPDGTLLQYNSQTSQFVNVTQTGIKGADGKLVSAGNTVARDRTIIPRGGYTVDLNGFGPGKGVAYGLQASDAGGAIVGYRLDYYNGVGPNACSTGPGGGFPWGNIMAVTGCSSNTTACPSDTANQ